MDEELEDVQTVLVTALEAPSRLRTTVAQPGGSVVLEELELEQTVFVTTFDDPSSLTTMIEQPGGNVELDEDEELVFEHIVFVTGGSGVSLDMTTSLHPDGRVEELDDGQKVFVNGGMGLFGVITSVEHPGGRFGTEDDGLEDGVGHIVVTKIGVASIVST